MSPLTLRRPLVAVGAAALFLLLTALPASAHLHPDPAEVPEGEDTEVGLAVEHGCDDSPTTEVKVRLPDGLDAAAMVRSGWSLDNTAGVVTWSAQPGNELPADETGVFELLVTPDPGTEGRTLPLKTVQTCETGTLRWIEVWDGEGEEPEHPAPTLTVLPAGADPGEDDHGGGQDPEDGSDDHSGDGAVVDDGDHGDSDGATADDDGHHTDGAADEDEDGHHTDGAADEGDDDHHTDAAAADGGDDPALEPTSAESPAGTEDDESVGIALVVLVLAAIGFGGVMLVRARRAQP